MLAHPASAAVIPGASKPERIAEDHAALKALIADEFWYELRQQQLVSIDAPLPIDPDRKQARASATVTLPNSPDEVWRLIGGFDSLPNWLAYIPKSELIDGGRVRRLANLQGDVIVERLEGFDDSGRSYSYSIVQSPFPMTGDLAKLQVLPSGSGSRVEWSARFTPHGVSSAEASRLFQGIFEGGLKALADRLVATNGVSV